MTVLLRRSTSHRERRIWNRAVDLQARLPLLQLVALIAVSVYGVITLPGIDSTDSIKTILVIASLIGLASLGQTLMILMGGFDLSIPGFMIATAYFVTTLKQTGHLSFVVALLLAVALCGSLGAFAGQICHRYQVLPLIVTLATGSIAFGLAESLAGTQSVGASPAALSNLTSPVSNTFGIGIPPVVVIWVLVAVLTALFLHRTVPGRHLLGTGSNQRAAEYSLIRTRWVWTLAFAFSGIASALVSLLVGSFAGTLNSTVAQPYLFESVIAVVIGGTVFGGPGDYTRTCIGALFLAVFNVVLIGNGGSANTQQIIYGIALLVVMTFYGRERPVRDRI